MTTLLIGWAESSKICRRRHRAQYRSSPPRAHQIRLVATSIVENSLHKSSRSDELFFLQDDLTKFVSEPASPPQLVEFPEEGKAKAKERREVGEGDDIVVVEDTSDEETLQERFQLRSRFSRPGLPHIPLVQDPPASLEASLPTPPRKPCNVARKRLAKKLKVTETISREVSHLEEGSRVLMSRVCVLSMKFPCLQEMPRSELVEQGDEGDWDTLGEAAGGSRSPAPTVEELLAQMECQPLLLRGAQNPLLLLLKRQRLQRRRRRRLPRRDWLTSPVSSAPQP
jgi:hypothetical protein